MSGIRVYPIRMTRKEWHIGLFAIHECTHGCNYVLVKDRKNKRYKCKASEVCQNNETIDTTRCCTRKDNIENTIISVNNFDITNPCGIFGKLHMADNIVIPHNEFTMILNYPLCTMLKITVNGPIGDGFTLKEVLYAIKLSYEDIYAAEEQTATQYTYILVEECNNCTSIDIKEKLEQEQNTNNINNREELKLQETEQNCSICQDNMNITNNDLIKVNKCNHMFHKECLYNWIDTNGKTCPLCRCLLYDCNNCKGTGYVTTYHEGIVPPIEFRGNTRRQRTDGIYGIYDYYLEDLYINSLKYNNELRELHVSIQT